MAESSEELFTSTEDSESFVLDSEELKPEGHLDMSEFEDEESEEGLAPIVDYDGLTKRAWEDQEMFMKRVTYTSKILEIFPKTEDGNYDGTNKEDLQYFCEMRFHKAKTNQKYEPEVEEFIKELDAYVKEYDSRN